MPLMDDITDAQKKFEVAIKETEAKKKQIDGLNAEWAKNGSDVSKEVQRVVGAMKEAQDALKGWSEGYDLLIEELKKYNKDFSEYKKRSLQAEKFYNDLKDEKDERDKKRKKLGAGSKPTKEEEIADAAFKKAQTAYENDPGKGVESLLKDIGGITKGMETSHTFIVSDLIKASKDHDSLCKALRGFADVTAVRSYNKSYTIESNPMGAEFDKYFKSLK